METQIQAPFEIYSAPGFPDYFKSELMETETNLLA